MKKKEEIWKKLPKTPGVYLFKSLSGKVLYVGKAINLRNRVKSYFSGKVGEKRVNDLLENYRKIDYVNAFSEIEALLLEARLIKQYQPKYNIRLKDDTRFLYVGITNDRYPRIILLRQPERQAGLLEWFGPFPSSYGIREILRLLRRIFPYCSDRRCNPLRPCFYYHLKLCPGVGIQSEEEYRQNIQRIRLFLGGKISSLIKKLTKQMKDSAKLLRFEEAEKIKNQIKMIENLLGRYKRTDEEDKSETQLNRLREIIVRYQGFDPFLIQKIETYDVANLGKNIVVGSMVVFINGEAQHSEYRQFRISGTTGDTEAIYQILVRRLKHQEWVYPQVIFVDGGKGQISATFKALLESKLSERIALLGLTKEEETIVVPKIDKDKISGWKLLKYSRDNPALQLLQAARDEAHRFAQRYYKKVYKQSLMLSGSLDQNSKDL